LKHSTHMTMEFQARIADADTTPYKIRVSELANYAIDVKLV